MLDIYVSGSEAFRTDASAKSFLERTAEYVCSFEDEGYYWFLFQTLEDLAKQTGQRIDLYGFTVFADKALDALEQALIAAHDLVETQPEVWQVKTGVRMKPLPMVEVHSEVNKQQMIAWLETLELEVHKAKITGRCVVFYGD